ncbi:uncharacterized protein LOC115624882 [Scaptodrosophila lebanonensis]|uniref:Uncharacterized protein LOC115624882 n=1 Tax=Drosophila lebanonensis TaxID=7225 RepID=A0A6J2TKB3_DROLE|nr:uncharacterized protein LOC115624882 [Scaptodrosophila lebanonensis]
MIYAMLQAVSTAIYTTFSTLWHIEQLLINFMMFCFFLVLRIACHPFMLIPMLLGAVYFVRKMLQRRKAQMGTELAASRIMPARTPRIRSYRSAGSLSSRSRDSIASGGNASEEEHIHT